MYSASDITARIAALSTRFDPRPSSDRMTNSPTAMTPARIADAFQVGGVLSRFSRASVLDCFL